MRVDCTIVFLVFLLFVCLNCKRTLCLIERCTGEITAVPAGKVVGGAMSWDCFFASKFRVCHHLLEMRLAVVFCCLVLGIVHLVSGDDEWDTMSGRGGHGEYGEQVYLISQHQIATRNLGIHKNDNR